MADEYLVSSTHPEDLTGGRIVVPGEVVSGINVKDEHTKRLIDEGRLVKLAAKKPAAKTTSKED